MAIILAVGVLQGRRERRTVSDCAGVAGDNACCVHTAPPLPLFFTPTRHLPLLRIVDQAEEVFTEGDGLPLWIN